MSKYTSEEDIHGWLSLVTQHGLFVSDPVLNTAFPKEIDDVSPDAFRAFKREFDLYSIYSERGEQEKYTRWINFILEDFLGFSKSSWYKHPNIPDDVKHYLFEYDQWLSPDRVLLSNEGVPLLLVKLVKHGQSLERPEREKGKWKASPYFKLTTLCLEKNIPLAILTNGEEFRIIHVKPTTGTSYFEWKARDCYEEKSLLDSFYTFLNKDRFFGDEQRRLLHLIDESQKRQLDVTDQLGEQMHHALEIFVRAIGNLNQNDLQEMFSNVTGEYIYEMCLTFLMRLVFLLYAEENGLLPHGNFVYENNYGISHLVYQLQSRNTDEQYMRKKDAWFRLLSLFHLIYGGCGHPDVKSIPYDSELFDPERFPQLEHSSFVLDNKTVWRILHNLCYAETKIGKERVKQKVSYHTIDVEQIGSVYESLIGFSVEKASEKMVIFKGGENNIRPVSEFINLDDDSLIDYLKSVTGKTEDSIQKILETNEVSTDGLDRLVSFFADDGIIEKSQLYISRAGSIRKSSGTYYTPKEITRFLVQEALEPLVYEETEDGKKIKSPREILDLNVCDPAMGSGAFLVQAIRYLSERLVESLTKINSDTDENITLPYGDISHGADNEEILPSDENEALQRAKLYVAQNCIYGVDRNPMAVELAKVSIWLTTMCRDRPLTFLDHRLKCGDSLIGTGFENISKIPNEPLRKENKKHNQASIKTKTLTGINFEDYINDIIELHTNLKSPELTIDDIKRKGKRYKEAQSEEKPISKLKEVFDLWTSIWFWPHDINNKNNSLLIKNKTMETKLFSVDEENNWVKQNIRNKAEGASEKPIYIKDIVPPPHTGEYREIALNILDLKKELNAKYQLEDYKKIIKDVKRKHQFFHWELEFPEVFLSKDISLENNPGFDCIVGNPPWDMIKANSQEFFSSYDPNFRSYESKIAKQKIIEICEDQNIKNKWDEYCLSFDLSTKFFRASKNYKYLGKGQLNLYQIFLEKFFTLIKNKGIFSIITPAGVYSGSTSKELREMLFYKTKLISLISFENRNLIFPIHRSFRFALITSSKDEPKKVVPSSLLNLDIDILNHPEKDILDFPISFIEKFSPDSLSLMDLTRKIDLDFISKIYSSFQVLGDYVQKKWDFDFGRELNLTDDRNLMNMNGEGIPIYEGKMIYQYNPNYDEPRLWIEEEILFKKLKNYNYKKYRIAYREVASSTNEYTLISTILPRKSSSVLTLYCSKFPESLQKDISQLEKENISYELLLTSIFNSYIMNYIIRHKVTEHVNLFQLYQLPVPDISNKNWFFLQLVPRICRLICINSKFSDLWNIIYDKSWNVLSIKDGGTSLLENWDKLSSPWTKSCGAYGWVEDNRDDGERATLRAEIEAIISHLYGLNKIELDYIFDTFPVLKKKEESIFGEYKSKELCLDEYDRIKIYVKNNMINGDK